MIGHFDGLVGQLEGWFEETTGCEIACYVYEGESFHVDVEAENKKRTCQTTDFPVDHVLKGKPFIVSQDWLGELKKAGINKVLPLNPNNRERARQIKTCLDNGLQLVSAIHPSVTILPNAKIGEGVWIHAGSLIGYKVEIETGVMINTRVQIDHHSVIQHCSQLDPGVATASYVTCRPCCHVHLRATIINRCEIGEDAIIGAGTVVIRDIPARCTAVGVPARIIKYH